MWHVYILKCSDGTFYTGCTSDMNGRFNRHNNGQVKYTSSRLPVDLIVTISFNDKYKAYDFENYLKSGSGKAFMKKRFI
jgi:predicted GIY-YIG superfamily endonuclease